MAREFSVVADGLTFAEGPRWHDGRLYFSDLYTHRVLSVNEDGSNLEVEAEVEDQTSGLGWLPDGRLVIVSMLDHKLLVRQHDGTVADYADLSGQIVGWANDLAVDSAGHAYVGHFGFDLFAGEPLRSTTLMLVDPSGAVSVAADGLFFPNGGTIIDDKVLVVSESFANRSTAFDIEVDGTLSNRREWAKYGEPASTDNAFEALGTLDVAPDGTSVVDAEGAMWVADFAHGRVLRVKDGQVVDEVSPGTGVFAVALGGADGRMLFIVTAPGFDPEERKQTTEGRIISTRVEVPARCF